ncbi:MAG: tRNA lysidine(34) synthetase TilS, partial [Opitutales bacterium]|nr:tRNA lysidine(34) synthetase TilS [Opitutales bacterium]
LGAPGSRKLQDIFTDRSIPADRRRCLPVVRDPNSGEILWVPGIPPSHRWRIRDDCKSALKLTYAEHCTA